MKYFEKISGQRIYLSPINPDDVETYCKWMNDPEVSSRLGNIAMLIDLKKEREFLEKLASKEFNFAIIQRDEQRLIGNCSLCDLNYISGTAEFGIFIGEPEDHGNGYGSEAARLLLDYAFGILNLRNIMLKVFAFNELAIGAYRKAGFKEFGRRSQAYYLNGQYHDVVYMQATRS
ncbi:GNAT family N-acetyltransferase [Spirochaeta dissipatitropha]